MPSELTQVAYVAAAKDIAWASLPIIMADMDSGEIVEISKFAAAIFGYELEELMGQSIETLVPDALRDAHARWRKDAAVPKTRLMGLGRQIMGRRKDGSVFPCHVGLTAMTALEKQIGVAFVIDLTSIVAMAQATKGDSP